VLSFKSSAALTRLAPLSGGAADGQQCRGYEEEIVQEAECASTPPGNAFWDEKPQPDLRFDWRKKGIAVVPRLMHLTQSPLEPISIVEG
jgi:hypothetical protein